MRKGFDKVNRKHIIKWGCMFLVICGILVGFYESYLKDRIPSYATHIGNKNEEQIIHDMTSEFYVMQKFSSPRDFDFITLDFSDHDQRINGKMVFLLRDNKGNVIYQKELSCSDIHYQQPVPISFEDLGGGKSGIEYQIDIFAQDTEETALGLYGYEVSDKSLGAVVNGEAQNYAVSIGIHSYTNLFHNLFWLEMLICAIGICLMIYLTGIKTISEEKLFLGLTVPFGICMLMLLSIDSVYDGDSHFPKNYHYSNVLLGKAENDNDFITYLREADVEAFYEKNARAEVENEQTQEFWRIYQDWEWTCSSSEMKEMPRHTAVAGGTILAYLPSVVGLTLARIVHLGSYPAIYFAKLCSFAAYLFMCYYAIKKTPILKTVFVFTAALPVSLYNATGITYDTMTISAVLLSLSHIFLWWERDLNKKEWITLGAAAILVGSCKGGVFLPVFLLMLAVPFKRFRLDKRKACILAFFFVGAIVVFFLKYGNVVLSMLQVNTPDMTTENPELRYGVGYCFLYPVEFLKMLFLSIVERGDIYIGQLLGYRTQWMNATIEWIIMIPFLLLLFAAAVKKEQEPFLAFNKRKIAVFLLLCAEFVGMHMILMSDTKVSSNFIYGVQGRYFVAVIPLLFFLFHKNIVVRKVWSEKNLYIFFSMMQMCYMFSYLDKFFNA